MADNQTTDQTSSNDEIDLGQLFNMIGRGFKNLFNWFLRVFLYFKKNFLILIGLAIAGAIIGFGLNQIVTDKLKTEVIVKPNLESKDYLYDVVKEIQANIESKDTSFFKKIGFESSNLKGYDITIDRMLDKENSSDDNLEYLELLEKFQDNGQFTDIIRSELLKKSSLEHRITFSYKDPLNGPIFTQKVMAYINSNSYYNELIKIKEENAKARIKQNEDLLIQIDGLITKYADKMAGVEGQFSEQRIVLDNEERLDIAELFELKNNLIRDIERKKIELKEQQNAISIINFGEPQLEHKAFFGKRIVLLPLIFIAIYFLIDIIKYLNRKAGEIQN
ncbi:hypothetical protein [uncultured Eudoraea sp.]|uniref:hypothetical protein n=1 Tax=uncultured Eudoraea sp. TaxID=1035614 RepID=UPI002601C1F5|nr:hypothetical protein [uncultured Eudoraea sp.]